MTILKRENVEDYPRPPVVEAVPHQITIRLEGALVAETSQALRVLETFHAPTYYVNGKAKVGQRAAQNVATLGLG